MNAKSCMLYVSVYMSVHVCKLCVCVCGGIGCVLRKVSVHICVYMYCVYV